MNGAQSFFKENLGWLNQLANDNGCSLIQLLDWPESTMVQLQYAAGPTIDQVQQLQECLNVNLFTLLDKDLSLLPNAEQEALVRRLKNRNKALRQSQLEVPLHPRVAGAALITSRKAGRKKDGRVKKSKLSFCLPIDAFTYDIELPIKAFEIEGHSMFPQVKNKDFIIAQQLRSLSDIVEGERYIVVLKDGSVFFKRIYFLAKDDQHLQLSADNLDYPQICMGKGLIDSVWRMCLQLT